jgi:hypothetical protein
VVKNICFWFIVGLALITGGFIYLQAPNGIIAYTTISNSYPVISSVLEYVSAYLPAVNPTGMLRFQGSDLLWAFSLSSVLIYIWRNNLNLIKALMVGCLTPLTYEVLQFNHVISGTFDWHDIVAMTIGGCLGVGFVWLLKPDTKHSASTLTTA